MSGMTIFVTVVHVLLAVFMIFVILLQPGKDAGMGAAFGGGAATSAFGGRGAVTFLSKLTAACATLFFITSLGLSFVGLNTSVTSRIAEKAAAATPEAPKTMEQGTNSAASVPATEANTKTDTNPGPLPVEVPPVEPAQKMGGDPAPAAPGQTPPAGATEQAK